jgi:hypothetical protein
MISSAILERKAITMMGFLLIGLAMGAPMDPQETMTSLGLGK